MNEYAKRIKDDLPQQFRERERIDGLIEAITEQFQDLAEFYGDLKASRFMTTAHGAQLDKIGQILSMSRRDAMEFLRLQQLPDDDQYRVALKYKSKLNFAEGTYRDVIDQLRIINRDGLGFSISESPDKPATVIFETLDRANSENVKIMLDTPVRLAGGVGLLIRATDGGELRLLTGVSVQTKEEREVAMDDSDTIEGITCFADGDDLIYTDYRSNLYII